MSLLLEFIVSLGKVVWICFMAFLKFFNPFKSKKNLQRDIVLVTGAGSGIGRLMALRYCVPAAAKPVQDHSASCPDLLLFRFAKLGAKLVLWDINKEANEAVAEEIKELGRTAHPYVCDCSKREEIYRVAEQVTLHALRNMHVNKIVHVVPA